MAKRILLVEDEAPIREMLKFVLIHSGFETIEAEDYQEAIDKIVEPYPDLILLDWMLPGLSGIEICYEFRKTFNETPIIFLTAKDTVDETIFGLQSGANDYIKKPFHFDELLERIKVQLRAKYVEHSSYSIGNITLNIKTHRVFKADEEIMLTQNLSASHNQ